MLMYSLILSAMAEPAAETKPEMVESTGNLRLVATQRPGFAVDFEGRELESGLVFDSRLRTQVDVNLSDWKLEVGGDLIDGQFAGSPWNLDGTTHNYHPEVIGVFNASKFQSPCSTGETQVWFCGCSDGDYHIALGTGNHCQRRKS